MLRIVMPERSSFRFSWKNNPTEAKIEEPELTTTAPVHEPLPFISHLSTNSLYDLFQGVPDPEKLDLSASIGVAITSPQDEKGISTISTGKQRVNRISTDPSAVAKISTPPVTLSTAVEDLQTVASSPSSGFRDKDDSSCCSRKSSTSSVGSPLPNQKSYFEKTEVAGGIDHLVQVTQDAPNWPLVPEIHLDKPLPLPPTPDQRFSISSAVSLMRANSVPTSLRMQHVEQPLRSPISSHRNSKSKLQKRVLHKKSVSMGFPTRETSSPGRTSNPGTSFRSRVGQGLGKAMHNRSISLDAVSKALFQLPKREELSRLKALSETDPNHTDSQAQEEVGSEPPQEVPATVSPSAAEKIVFKIMLNLDSPADLIATARLSRGFYDTFRRREVQLMDAMLFRLSPPAWEFEKNSSEAASELLSLRNYVRDNAVLGFIKSSMLSFGDSVLRPETLAGLAGADAARKSRIDDALWRIWTFCKGFGYRSLAENELALQVDWLNGGRIARERFQGTSVGAGNGTGVSKEALEDILELWDCFDTLLGGFRGRVDEAREVGIFKSCSIDAMHTEEWFLDEWTCYVRSIGLPAILSLSSSLSFEQAQKSGYTEWKPPSHSQSRADFMTSAIRSAYQERLLTEAAENATQITLPPRSVHRAGDSAGSLAMLERVTLSRLETRPSQIKRKPLSPIVATFGKVNTTWQPETPDTPLPKHLSERQPSPEPKQADRNFPERNPNRGSVTSPTRNSAIFHSLGMTPTASTRLGATLFPMEYPPTSPEAPTATLFSRPQPKPRSRVRKVSSAVSPAPEVIDPADKAMALLTKDMGFSVADASRALAKCDTGFGLDVQRAIEMLSNEKRKAQESAAPPTSTLVTSTAPGLLTSSTTIASPTSPRKPKTPREYCTGHPPGHSRGSSTSSTASQMADTWPVRDSSLTTVGVSLGSRLSRMTSKAKAYRVQRMERKDSTTRANHLIFGGGVVEQSHEHSIPARMKSIKLPKMIRMGAVEEGEERPSSSGRGLSVYTRQTARTALGRKKSTKNNGKEAAKLGEIAEEIQHDKALKILGVDEDEVLRTESPVMMMMMAEAKKGKSRKWNLGWDANSMRSTLGSSSGTK